jgi:hypothetical protein
VPFAEAGVPFIEKSCCTRRVGARPPPGRAGSGAESRRADRAPIKPRRRFSVEKPFRGREVADSPSFCLGFCVDWVTVGRLPQPRPV